MANQLVEFIRDVYQTREFIPLHAPKFSGNELRYVNETIESTFVSSVGKFVDQFEGKVASFAGANCAVATVNGTAALHSALHLADVKSGDLVITQALTFVATCNALFHMGVEPIFIDVSEISLGLCPVALGDYLENNAELNDAGICIHRASKKIISAVVPMHTFGHPAQLDELIAICGKWNIPLIEDAAESLGSYYKGRHTGTIGRYAALSFNGNKIITTGGGGMIFCQYEEDGKRAKHLTTTAKVPHPYEFYHDEAGFNYRLPNINAALGCAQMEILEKYLYQKRQLAERYRVFFEKSEFEFFVEPEYAKSNYWLNAVVCKDKISRDALLHETNNAEIMTRPVWRLMSRLPMFENAYRGDLSKSEFYEERLVSLPSSPIGDV